MAALSDATDFANLSLVASDKSSSIILSTPPLPKTTGTPMETSEKPYSPSRLVETLITRLRPVIMASAMIAMTVPGAYTVLPLSWMTSAPEVTVECTMLSICSVVSRLFMGMPETEAYSTNGIMLSPCSPITQCPRVFS